MRLAFKWKTRPALYGRGYRPAKEQCNEKAETKSHGGV